LGGAIYSRWFGLAWHLGRGRNWPRKISTRRVEQRMDYVVGASLFVSRDFLQTVGLMEESYFLYYEELDWAVRARRRFPLAWAPDSRVYHKVGGTIGTSSHPARKSLTSDFYTLRNRIRFTRRFCPWALPTVYLGLVGACCLRLMFGEWHRVLMVIRLMTKPSRSFEDCCQG
jgi:GT2 family glycosyltransferase